MSYWYTTSRALLFSKAHRGAVMKMILVWLSVLLLAVGTAHWGIAVYRDIARQATEYTFVVVLKQGVPDSLQREMVRTLSAINAVQTATRVDSLENWRNFANDIGLHSDNILMLANIPTTIEVRFKNNSLTTSHVLATKTAIYTTYPAAVSSIIYHPEILQRLETQQYTLRWFMSVAVVGFVLLCVLVFKQGFMAEVYASANHFYVAKTLGTGVWFVAVPHLLIGTLCWLVAAATTMLVWYNCAPLLFWVAPWLMHTTVHEIILVVCSVSTFCAAMYTISVVRFATYIEIQNT